MPGALGQPPISDAPLYIRWGPDRCPYAIELKLDLIDRLRSALIEATAGKLEVEGILVGSLPTSQMPTLRIEGVEFLARRTDDSSTSLLEGVGSERFMELRRRAQAKERSMVGFFRSHLRSGPLRPSLADRTLLAGEFKDPVYALLLAEGYEPFGAAFFVASNGPLPAEMSVREFRLNSDDFQALPELEPEFHGKYSTATSGSPRSGFITTAAFTLMLLCATGGFYYFNQSLFQTLLPAPKTLQLTVQPQNGLIRISWNSFARELDDSTGATLVLRPGRAKAQRRIRIGLDELRLGAVAYEVTSPKGEVTLELESRGKTPSSHSVVWGE